MSRVEIESLLLRAPWAQIGGEATKAMLLHRRGAASTETGSRLASPIGDSDAARDNNRFSAIIVGIVKSAPFQMNTKS